MFQLSKVRFVDTFFENFKQCEHLKILFTFKYKMIEQISEFNNFCCTMSIKCLQTMNLRVNFMLI